MELDVLRDVEHVSVAAYERVIRLAVLRQLLLREERGIHKAHVRSGHRLHLVYKDYPRRTVSLMHLEWKVK